MEVQKEDGSIEFLDTTVYNDGQSLKTKWFHKPIASNRLLNYYSKHPRSMVINTAKAFIRRVFTLSHASFHQENRATIKRILGKNNFPAELTERLLHQVGQMMFNTRSNGSSSYPLISRTELTEASGVAEDLALDWGSTPPRANSTVIDTTLTPAAQPPKKTRFAGMTYVPGLSEAVSKQIGKYAPDIKIASRPFNQIYHVLLVILCVKLIISKIDYA
ncbi:hypothetical protein HA402_005641 [Bradysia odoriphaga]|nr:hypothetical protein HA402_005641 [Bradysia odoriphaga]